MMTSFVAWPSPGRAVRLGAAAALVCAAVAGCGGSSSPSSGATPSATGTGTGQRRGFDSAQFQKIRECLSAAGISLPTPTGTFTRRPSGNPTDGGTPPTGAPPSGAPTGGAPTGGPGGGFGGGGGFGRGTELFADPKVRAALAACGIAIPTGRPTPSTTG